MSGKVVTFGEIMLRLTPPGFERLRRARTLEATYGGGEANVAASLASFGVQTEFVTRLPENDLGLACLAFLRQQGILSTHVVLGGDRMGIYFLETGVAQRPSVVLYDRAGSSFAMIRPGMVDWRAVFEGADWFHWTGITPAISEEAAQACKEAVTIGREMGLTVSCDLNYRARLWKWTSSPGKVMQELVGMCDLAIGNEEDAEKFFGIQAPESDVRNGKLDPERYRTVCTELAQRLPGLKYVAITLRGSLSASHNTWSGVLWHRGGFQIAPVYDILPIVDRVGGGDAFSGGLIYGMREFGGDLERALRFAVAASCLKHSIPGDFNAVTLPEVEQLMAGDGSGRISR